jgi:hypothetical protein
MGHTHKLLVYKPEDTMFMRDRNGTLEASYTDTVRPIMAHVGYIDPCHRWYCNTGGFLKLYSKEAMSGYAEIGMYPPIEVGYINVKVRDGKIISAEKCYV